MEQTDIHQSGERIYLKIAKPIKNVYDRPVLESRRSVLFGAMDDGLGAIERAGFPSRTVAFGTYGAIFIPFGGNVQCMNRNLG